MKKGVVGVRNAYIIKLSLLNTNMMRPLILLFWSTLLPCALLESSTAEEIINDYEWTYTATQANSQLVGSKIIAIATDVQGNEAILDVSLQGFYQPRRGTIGAFLDNHK